MTFMQATLTSYSFDVMIVTQNQRTTKVVWPPSQWSKTRKNKTGLSMITFYHCFIDINTDINNRK